jgi:hypothetical protein
VTRGSRLRLRLGPVAEPPAPAPTRSPCSRAATAERRRRCAGTCPAVSAAGGFTISSAPDGSLTLISHDHGCLPCTNDRTLRSSVCMASGNDTWLTRQSEFRQLSTYTPQQEAESRPSGAVSSRTVRADALSPALCRLPSAARRRKERYGPTRRAPLPRNRDGASPGSRRAAGRHHDAVVQTELRRLA